MNEPSEVSAAEYHDAVNRFIDSIDEVLERGRQSQRRQDSYFLQHNIEPGCGEKALIADTLPPAQRRLHAGVLELTKQFYAEMSPSQEKPKLQASAASRALANRTRI